MCLVLNAFSFTPHAALVRRMIDRYGSNQSLRRGFGLFSLVHGELHGDASIERYNAVGRPSIAVELQCVDPLECHPQHFGNVCPYELS